MYLKTIFITGGSRGIGEAVVRRLAGKCNVVFTYNQSEERAMGLEKELASFGGVLAVKCDVRSSAEVNEAFRTAKKRFSRVDGLVNCAGVSCQKLFTDLSDGDWRNTFAVNCDGAFFASRAALPDMIRAGYGAIVNVSSIWGQTGASMETAYSASKAALIGLTKALAKEAASSGITVNAVAPGAVDTDMMKEYSKDEIEAVCKEIPLGRMATADEVADAIVFLLGQRYITGQVLGVNGGLYI